MHLLSIVLLMLMLATSVSGCGVFGSSKEAEVNEPTLVTETGAEAEEEALAEEKPLLTPREYFLGALDALQRGHGEQAKEKLTQLLVLEPGNKVAVSLIEQIDADPVAYLGKESFSYKTQFGDSMSSVAKRFLGDPLKFYILARYNNIVDSSHLGVGHILKIPGKRPLEREAADTRKSSSSAADLRLLEAKRLYNVAKYPEAITALENALKDDRDSSEARDLIVNVYVDYARALARGGQLRSARSLLEKSMSNYPDRRLNRQYDLIRQQLESDRLYREGLSHQKAGALVKAYDNISRAIELQPGNEQALRKQRELQPAVINEYHRLATKAFRAQDLDQAISYWDKVLKIDPNHTLANNQRAKAIELRERLKKMQ